MASRSRSRNDGLLAERLTAIERAAARLLSQRSYSTTTVEEIAHAAGMSVGLIYRYVDGKQGILHLIFDHILSRYESELPPAAQGSSSPEEKLWRAMQTYLGIIDTEPARTLITYRESGQLDEATRQAVKRREQESNRPLESILSEGIDRGVFMPVNVPLLAYDIAVLSHMWALKNWWLRERMTVEDYAAEQYQLLLSRLTVATERPPPLSVPRG